MTTSLYIKKMPSGVLAYVAGCTSCNMPPRNNTGDFMGFCEFCTEGGN